MATAADEDTETKTDEAAAGEAEEEKEPLPYPLNDPTEMVQQASATVPLSGSLCHTKSLLTSSCSKIITLENSSLATAKLARTFFVSFLN